MATKWQLHRLYSKHSILRKHLPPTSPLTTASLSNFMDKYRTVYIKGNTQHMGRGIIKAWKTKTGYRFIKVRGKSVYSKTIADLYKKVTKGTAGKSLLVQKAIDLARVKGRPYDIRVMLMMDGKGNWKYAGMLAKVAGKGSVISNVRRGGGYAITIDEALIHSLGYGRERIAAVKRELTHLGFETIRYSTKHGFRSYETGIDMAIDQKGKTWIIEANLQNPSHELFNRLPDKSFFRKIKSYAASYRKRHKN